jgi:hypothetical protein
MYRPSLLSGSKSATAWRIFLKLWFWVLLIGSNLAVGTTLMAQDPDAEFLQQPFTEDELYQAFRLASMHEADARKLAREMTPPLPPLAARLPQVPRPISPDEIAQGRELLPWEYGPAAVADFSNDILIILSLVSDELSAKVDRYRAAWQASDPSNPAEERAWQARHAKIKKVLDEKGNSQISPPSHE